MKKILLSNLFIIVIIIIILLYFPVKLSVDISNVAIDDSFIIVEIQKSTISQWRALSSNGENYDIPVDVRINGSIPTGFNFQIETGRNQFICYGEFSGEEFFEDTDEKFLLFDSYKWDIIYPIKRDSILDKILPDKYLSLYDFIH